MLVEEGENYDFPSKESAKNAPLANRLFELEYVTRVFYMSNFITVTKTENIDWLEIREELKTIIKEYLEDGLSLLSDKTSKEDPASQSDESDLERRIKEILDEYVKPAVEQDGGAISYASFNDGVVKVKLQGACSGCPSSLVTLKAGIENLLIRLIPEVKEVDAEGI
jgi:Fe-S cluster biogenesis protein NfuA